MFQQKLIDNKGTPILLSNELGRGGEGTVFNIQNNPALVAKIYNKTPDFEKSDKISSMVKMGNERILKLATWPINSIHTSDNKLIGFTMPKLVDHKPIFELYSPKKRLQEFPKADWRFLIHAAINTARAFLVIHDAGHVIGDVNHGNLLVASDATVQFIDTDSFQIYSNGKYWFCEVGVPTHQPPEMQDKTSYKGIIRTPNHDNFGLAILIFQLLCLARHPFAGRYSGSGDMSIEKAILEFRYAYGSDTTTTKMSPPPASLPMSALTPTLRLYFERAFSREGEKLGFRPNPRDWITALTELSSKLKNCHVNLSHHYFIEMKNCPWCDIETKCNSPFFPITGPKAQVDINITSLWQQFLSIKNPGGVFNLPDVASIHNTPSNGAEQVKKKLRKYQINLFVASAIAILCFSLTISLFPIIALVVCCMALGSFVLYSRKKKVLVQGISSEFNSVKLKWEEMCSQRESIINNYNFEHFRQQIVELKQKHDALKSEREYKFNQLLQNRFQQQLKQHLDRYRIATANIEGIGQGRVATLQSYLVETAGDIDSTRLMGINGFGRVLVTRLVAWRKDCEAKFVFNSSQGVGTMEIASLDRDIASKRQQIESELSTKISQLALFSKQISSARQNLQNQMYEILPKYAQALADAKAVGLKT